MDAQLPPSLATSLRQTFAVDARHIAELGFLVASDEAIFAAARSANAVVMTKDSDFIRIQEREGPPPKILWLTIGNVNNAELWKAVERSWSHVVAHFDQGERLVEIGRPRGESTLG